MEHNSAIKMNEVLIHAIARVNPGKHSTELKDTKGV